jgi:hypothetical protein
MRSVAVADFVVVPSAPVAVSVRVPFLALDVTVTVSVAFPFPPGTEDGPTTTVMPVVPPAPDRLTVPV